VVAKWLEPGTKKSKEVNEARSGLLPTVSAMQIRPTMVFLWQQCRRRAARNDRAKLRYPNCCYRDRSCWGGYCLVTVSIKGAVHFRTCRVIEESAEDGCTSVSREQPGAVRKWRRDAEQGWLLMTRYRTELFNHQWRLRYRTRLTNIRDWRRDTKQVCHKWRDTGHN